MIVQTWNLNSAQLDGMLNDANKCLIERVMLEGIITQEQADKMAYYAITVSNKEESRFGSWLNNLLFKHISATKNVYTIVKVFTYQKEVKKETEDVREAE